MARTLSKTISTLAYSVMGLLSPQLTTNRAQGIDISKYQVSYFARKLVDFVIQRLSYGMKRDEKYHELRTPVLAAPVSGAYHYFSSGAPWDEQADLFLSLGKDYDFYALDFESAYNNINAQFIDDGRKWMERVHEATGKQVLLYTNPSIYQTWFNGLAWAKEWPLWIAQYWFSPSPNKNPGMHDMDRDDWTFYQYSADTPPNFKGAEYGVESRNIDLDVFNGTVEDLFAWAGVSQVPTPPVPIPAPERPLTDAQVQDLTYRVVQTISNWNDPLDFPR